MGETITTSTAGFNGAIRIEVSNQVLTLPDSENGLRVQMTWVR